MHSRCDSDSVLVELLREKSKTFTLTIYFYANFYSCQTFTESLMNFKPHFQLILRLFALRVNSLFTHCWRAWFAGTSAQ